MQRIDPCICLEILYWRILSVWRSSVFCSFIKLGNMFIVSFFHVTRSAFAFADYKTMRKDVRDTVNRVRFKSLDIQDFTDGENEASESSRHASNRRAQFSRGITPQGPCPTPRCLGHRGSKVSCSVPPLEIQFLVPTCRLGRFFQTFNLISDGPWAS
jgi:hypothetical protein